MKKCQQCNRIAACCEWCGLCSLCGETAGSVLNDALCAKCAGDPVVPDDPAWWEGQLEQADYQDALGYRTGFWAGGLIDAIYKAQNNRWNTPWDSLWDAEVENYEQLYREREGLLHLVDGGHIEEEDIDAILAASDPLDALDDYGIGIRQWIFDDANFSMSHIAEELEASSGDIDVAIILCMLPKQHQLGLWGEMMGAALKLKRYGVYSRYQRMAAALHIAPTLIDTEMLSDSYSEHDVLGLCPDCLFPVTAEMLLGDGGDNEGGDCWYCNNKYDLRLATLWWLHYQGLLTDDPGIFTNPKYCWVLWPAEMEMDVSESTVLGDSAIKEISKNN